mgnify:CR=1 FL=1
MSKITKKGNHIFVPDHVTIPYIEGDGVGHEITPVSQKIVNAAIKQAYNGTRSIEWKEVLAGEKAEVGFPMRLWKRSVNTSSVLRDR